MFKKILIGIVVVLIIAFLSPLEWWKATAEMLSGEWSVMEYLPYMVIGLAVCITGFLLYRLVTHTAQQGVVEQPEPRLIDIDEDVTRDRFFIFACFIITTVVVIGLPLLVAYIATGYVIKPLVTGLIWATAIIFAGEFYARLLPRRMLNLVPNFQGFIVQDIIRKKIVAFGPGLHLSCFWFTRGEESNIPLETITLKARVDVPTKTSSVGFIYMFQYKVYAPNMIAFAAVNASTIATGFMSFLSSSLSEKWAQETAEYARSTGVADSNEDLGREYGQFKEDGEYDDGDKIHNLRHRYGVITVVTKIDSIEFPEDVQRSIDALSEASVAFESVATLYGITKDELRVKMANGEISTEQYRSMLNQSLASSGNAAMTIVEGSAGNAVAAGLNKILN